MGKSDLVMRDKRSSDGVGMNGALARGGQWIAGELDRRDWQPCTSGHGIEEETDGTDLIATGDIERELEQQDAHSRTVECCVVAFIEMLSFFGLVDI
jgi:hypothetical protein